MVWFTDFPIRINGLNFRIVLMKKIKLLLTITIGFLLLNCTDMKEGFLMTENARFYPDSLIISAYTGEQTELMDNDYPYQSNQISGVDGTDPVRYTVVAVLSDNGFDKGLEYVYSTLDGRIEIMRRHQMPAGNYSVDLRIYTDDYSVVIPDCFKIIAKEETIE